MLCRGRSQVLATGWEGKDRFTKVRRTLALGLKQLWEAQGLGWLFSASSPCFQFITSSYSIISSTNECKLTMLLLFSSFGWCSEAEHSKQTQDRDTTACKEPWEIRVISYITYTRDHASSLIFGNAKCLPMFSGGILGAASSSNLGNPGG